MNGQFELQPETVAVESDAPQMAAEMSALRNELIQMKEAHEALSNDCAAQALEIQRLSQENLAQQDAMEDAAKHFGIDRLTRYIEEQFDDIVPDLISTRAIGPVEMAIALLDRFDRLRRFRDESSE